MSIRPVDLQIVIPKTSEAAKVNQNENLRGDMQQHMIAQAQDKLAERVNHQVIKSTKTEQNNINPDEERRREQQSRRKNKKNNKNSKDDEQATKTNIFDMRI